MILQKLCEYYDRVDSDPTQTIAQEGFAPQKVSFAVVINRDGSLHEIQDIRDTGDKPTPRIMRLPYEKRTSGVKAMFLWDKPEYLLGHVPIDLAKAPVNESKAAATKRQRKIQRIAECHGACKTLHESFDEAGLDFAALLAFFSSWTPETLSDEQRILLEEVGSYFGVFRIKGNEEYIHEAKELRQLWVDTLNNSVDESMTGQCLITGADKTLARLHPVVKGVRGAQTSGASVVSFNDDAFTSYGKTQSYNAPVSEQVAFKYTTALNRMLEKDSGRKLQVGDTTCVFWADKPTVTEDLFAFGLDNETQFEDEAKAAEVENMLTRARDGTADYPDSDVGFQILGLSPNASRLSVRFWIQDKAETLINRIAEHQKRLQIVKGPKDRDLIPLWVILAQTARESKEIQPLLGGALLRSVLAGHLYPQSLLSAILRRVRAEQEVRHIRAAAIKAILIRNYSKDIPVMLDTERTESAYHLGRLFACLERAQEDALPGLNATIKDRYFSSASATPVTVFPRLIRLSQHHIGKLEGGRKVVAEKRIQEIVGQLSDFPSHLNLESQGLFAIGYYHQRQDFFTKKEEKTT